MINKSDTSKNSNKGWLNYKTLITKIWYFRVKCSFYQKRLNYIKWHVSKNEYKVIVHSLNVQDKILYIYIKIIIIHIVLNVRNIPKMLGQNIISVAWKWI